MKADRIVLIGKYISELPRTGGRVNNNFEKHPTKDVIKYNGGKECDIHPRVDHWSKPLAK